MWAPIIFNFVTTLITIIGLFGAYYRRQSYLTVSAVSSGCTRHNHNDDCQVFSFYQIVAFAWNSFVIAFYMELGELRRDSDILNLGTTALDTCLMAFAD